MENELKPLVTISTPNLANVAAESVTINWDYEIESASPEDIRFEVAVKGEMADGTPWIRFEAPEKNTCTITGLKPDTKYSIFVVAIHENEDIAQAPDSDDGVVVTTSANTPPPVAPKKKPWKMVAIIAGSVLAGMVLLAIIYFYIAGLQVRPSMGEIQVYNITDNGVSMQWKPAYDNFTPPEKIEYIINVVDETGERISRQNNTVGKTYYHFEGLKPNTTYTIYVWALDKQRNADSSPEVTIKTTDTVCPVVKDPKVSAYYVPSEDKIFFSWTPANDEGTDAEKIRYKVTNGDKKHSIEVVGKNSCSISAYGLPRGNKARFNVIAVDENGNSTSYDTVSITL